jgi:hypothetical protein
MDPLEQAKRFLLSHESSQVIDDLALKLSGKAIEEKRGEIKSSADDLAAELRRQGASPKFVRAVRATFEVLLYEKIAVAEAEATCQPQ